VTLGRAFLLPIIFGVVVGAQSPSDSALQSIHADSIRADMRFLADDLLEGRGTGSRGYELAAKYVASRFESMGLAPAGDDDSYFQAVSLTRASLVERQTSLVLVSSQRRRTLSFARDFLTFASVAHDHVRVMSDVVFLGYGITAPERTYDDYGALNVRGKIVAVLPGTPPSFSGDARAYYGALAVKQENALLHGAVGILHLNPTDDPLWELWIRFIRSGSVDWRRDARGPDGVAMLSAAASAALFNGTRMSLPDIVEARSVPSVSRAIESTIADHHAARA